MERRSRIIIGLFGIGLVVALVMKHHPAERSREEACAGPPLTSVEERDVLKVAGFTINERYNCIDKLSFATAGKVGKVSQVAASPMQSDVSATNGASLADARRGVSTTLSQRAISPRPLPTPPPTSFVRTDYASTAGLVLPAF